MSGLTVCALVARGLDIEKMGIFDVLVCDGPGGGVCFSVNVSRARQGLSRRGYSYTYLEKSTFQHEHPGLTHICTTSTTSCTAVQAIYT